MPVPFAIPPSAAARFRDALSRPRRQQVEFWRRYRAGGQRDPGDDELIELIAAFWRSRWFSEAAPEAAALGRACRLRRQEWSLRARPRLRPSAAIREELQALYGSLTPSVERSWKRFESDRVLGELARLSDPDRDLLRPLVRDDRGDSSEDIAA